MKRVTWYDDDSVDDADLDQWESFDAVEQGRGRGGAERRRRTAPDRSVPPAPPAPPRLAELRAAAEAVQHRLRDVRRRVHALSREMDGQLAEARQSAALLALLAEAVGELRREAAEDDRRRRAYYERERAERAQSPSRRARMEVR